MAIPWTVRIDFAVTYIDTLLAMVGDSVASKLSCVLRWLLVVRLAHVVDSANRRVAVNVAHPRLLCARRERYLTATLPLLLTDVAVCLRHVGVIVDAGALGVGVLDRENPHLTSSCHQLAYLCLTKVWLEEVVNHREDTTYRI